MQGSGCQGLGSGPRARPDRSFKQSIWGFSKISGTFKEGYKRLHGDIQGLGFRVSRD